MIQIHAVHVPTTLPDDATYASRLQLLEHDPAALHEIQRFRLIDDSKRALISRLLPRYVLALQGLDWRQLRFENREYGRPFAIHPDLPKDFQYSISHDAEWVICASTFSTEQGKNLPVVKNLGADAMRLSIPWDDVDQEGMLAIMKDQLSPTELAHIHSHPQDLETLFSYWVLKEAYIKARSLGLRGFPELMRIEFHLDFHLDERGEDQSVGWKKVKGSLDGDELDGWWFGLKKLDGGRYLVGVALEWDEGGERGGGVDVQNLEVEVLDQGTVLNTLERRSDPM